MHLLLSSLYNVFPSPSGMHLHCLHFSSRAHSSSGLGALSSQSQPEPEIEVWNLEICPFYDQETNECAFFGKRLIMMTHCNQVKTRASPQPAVSVCSYYETHPSPCGRHLHCLHSWSRGQNSSALGAVSSQSQPVTCHVISVTRHTPD